MENETPYLSDIEKEKVTVFLNDKMMLEAVRKIMLKRVYSDGILVPDKQANNPYENFFMNIYKNENGEVYSNEELGAITKAKRFAIELVQRGFKDLESFKNVKEVKQEKAVNKAR